MTVLEVMQCFPRLAWSMTRAAPDTETLNAELIVLLAQGDAEKENALEVLRCADAGYSRSLQAFVLPVESL